MKINLNYAFDLQNTYVVYVLRTSGGTIYVGITNNLVKRLEQHKNQKTGAKYLRQFSSFELVYQEVCSTKSAALRRELSLKKLSKAQKEALVLA